MYEDSVPVGVIRQVSGRPSPTYRILGLALVAGWEAGYFLLEGLSPHGRTDAIPARAQVNLLIALHEEAASNEGTQITESIKEGLDRVIASIIRRRGQPEFPQGIDRGLQWQVCDKWMRCRGSSRGMPYSAMRGSQTNRVSNGLLMRADLHTLFDVGLLAVNPSNVTVVIAPSLLQTTYREFSGEDDLGPGRHGQQTKSGCTPCSWQMVGVTVGKRGNASCDDQSSR